MPSRRKFTKRKSKKRSRWGTYRAAGRQLWKDVKFLKEMVNAEKKYYDSTASASAANTGIVLWLSNMAQSTTGNGRLGNSIKMNAINLRLQWGINASAAGTFVRAVLFVDKETRGTTPLVTDVLATPSTYAPLNMSNTKRFQILFDNIRSMDQTSIQAINIKKYFPYEGHVKWDTSGSSAIANAEEGHIFLLLILDQVTNQPVYTYYSRLRFYDN